MLEAQQRDLDELSALPGNPKRHETSGIGESVDRFGFLERIVVNRQTQHIVSGHGRVEALRNLREQGQPAPENIEVKGGKWLVPVDVVDLPEKLEMAAAIALNRWVEKGGWDDSALLEALLREGSDEASLRGLGYDQGDIEVLTSMAALADLKVAPSGLVDSERALDPREANSFWVWVPCRSEAEMGDMIRRFGKGKSRELDVEKVLAALGGE